MHVPYFLFLFDSKKTIFMCLELYLIPDMLWNRDKGLYDTNCYILRFEWLIIFRRLIYYLYVKYRLSTLCLVKIDQIPNYDLSWQQTTKYGNIFSLNKNLELENNHSNNKLNWMMLQKFNLRDDLHYQNLFFFEMMGLKRISKYKNDNSIKTGVNGMYNRLQWEDISCYSLKG